MMHCAYCTLGATCCAVHVAAGTSDLGSLVRHKSPDRPRCARTAPGKSARSCRQESWAVRRDGFDTRGDQCRAFTGADPLQWCRTILHGQTQQEIRAAAHWPRRGLAEASGHAPDKFALAKLDADVCTSFAALVVNTGGASCESVVQTQLRELTTSTRHIPTARPGQCMMRRSMELRLPAHVSTSTLPSSTRVVDVSPPSVRKNKGTDVEGVPARSAHATRKASAPTASAFPAMGFAATPAKPPTQDTRPARVAKSRLAPDSRARDSNPTTTASCPKSVSLRRELI